MASKCSIADIANKLISARKEKKGATLLLGEGCLESSGIPSEKEFVEIIQKTYPAAFEKAKKKDLPAIIARYLSTICWSLTARKKKRNTNHE